MAFTLPQTFTPLGLSQEVHLPEAYFRVEEVSGTKTKVTAVLRVYEKKGATMPLWEKKFEFKPRLDGPNFIQQAYDYILGLRDFKDATSV
jgi:hypothetical protein